MPTVMLLHDLMHVYYYMFQNPFQLFFAFHVSDLFFFFFDLFYSALRMEGFFFTGSFFFIFFYFFYLLLFSFSILSLPLFPQLWGLHDTTNGVNRVLGVTRKTDAYLPIPSGSGLWDDSSAEVFYLFHFLGPFVIQHFIRTASLWTVT